MGSNKRYAELHALHGGGAEDGTPLKGGRAPEREADDGTLEDALLDPDRAESIRASVDGEWVKEP